MVLKRLPLDVQSIFCASTQIKTFKTAVEELVYNSLDANSTSIAVRVNIQENYIQVVDNGHGVNKDDFHLLGQRYTTSRYEDTVSSESIHKYGLSGQSLANIIQISQSVKITAQCKNSEETWFKHFYYGKEKECTLTSTRPSVGTTVEIEGFLYNLAIQKKTVKALQELQRIKTFLEQMSLVHCNTSLSLRDNSENEIIFKIHKKRDIYQTLSLVLGMEKSNLQELQVEKNQYKVTGFIQKPDTESHGYQWIFINKRFIDISSLHKIINHNLLKSLPQKRITKVKNQNNEEEKITTSNKVPDYFIFIKCPPNCYETLSNAKKSMLEFKNCSQINKLLEKLAFFFNDGISLTKKPLGKKIFETEKSNTNDTNTRNEVKIIIEKFLGSHHKKINGSLLHNGVKGKNVKRKMKKLEDSLKLNASDKKNRITPETHKCSDFMRQNKCKVNDNEFETNCGTFKIPKNNRIRNKELIKSNKEQKPNKAINPKKNKYDIITKDPIISKFEIETGEVQKRCQVLSKKVDGLLAFKRKRKCKVFTNEYVQYSSIIRDSKKMTIRKKIDEIIIHEYLPLLQKDKAMNRVCNNIMKSDDLLRPVTTAFETNYVQVNKVCAHTKKKQTGVYGSLKDSVNEQNIAMSTYESHCYIKASDVQKTKQQVSEKHYDYKFISHSSQDNFLFTKKRKKEFVDSPFPIPAKKNTVTKKSNLKKTDKYKKAIIESQSSYSIHFTETNSRLHETPHITPIVSDIVPADNKSSIRSTYTIIDSDKHTNDVASKKIIQNAIDMNKSQDTHFIEELRASDDFHYRSLYNDSPMKSITPDICETFCLEETHATNDYTDQYFKLRDFMKVDTTPKICETYSIEASRTNRYTDQSPEIQECQDSINRNTTSSLQRANDFNVMFISNSQKSNSGINNNTDIDPLRICETVMDHQDAYHNDEYNFIFNSVNDITEQNIAKPTELFEIEPCNNSANDIDAHILNAEKRDCTKEINPSNNTMKLNSFHLKNRRRFIPKGMSPIFEYCNTKGACDYEFDKDYFEETVYNNFVEDVHINSEIFEPKIQSVKELATTDVEKINDKLNKDNACLTFNGESLKQLKVLGQVDYKFIATKIKDKSKGARDYLVLFDQHAVDERIRLEKNMSVYFDGDQWKSVTLDGITLRLTKDEILYLHNYRKKFHKLGLEWTILDNTEVSVTAIPVALLGKNSRQVETVLKAVKSLIKEEINMIKEQGGCLSLYPKSVMDLVFSEACRYAIMFGDALSKENCVGLMDALSECKTPFQCAHGRPVMAVLMDIGTEKHEYKVDFKMIQQFRRMQNFNK